MNYEAQADCSKVVIIPPQKPKAGEVYYYKAEETSMKGAVI